MKYYETWAKWADKSVAMCCVVGRIAASVLRKGSSSGKSENQNSEKLVSLCCGASDKFSLMKQRCEAVNSSTFFVCGLLSLCALAGAQQKNTERGTNGRSASAAGIVIRVQSRLVLLDVVVTDPKGEPVSGLRREDFVVYEDGSAQTIKNFESPTMHQLPAPEKAVKAATAFRPEVTASYGQSPVTLLVLDELNTHFSDVHFAVDAVRRYLQARPTTLNSPTLLAAVTDKGFRMLHDYTRDRDALLKALNTHKPDYAWKLELGGSVGEQTVERLDLSVSALEQLAGFSARIPGRKNLVWVGKGFPSLDPNALGPEEQKTLDDTMQHVTDTLLDRRVTLYAVDPTSNAPGMSELTDDTQVAFAQASGENATRSMDPFNTGLDFDKLGPVSGGRVVRGMNDVDQQIEASVELGAQYYSISYTPASDNTAAAGYRKITVKCLRPGTQVMTREGYYSGAAARQKSAVNSTYDLNNAVMAAVPFTALKLRAEPLGEGRYSVHVAAPGLTWEPSGGGEQVAHAQVLGAALAADGRILNHTLHTMTVTARAGTDVLSPSLPADFAINVAVPSGTARLRFIVRDVATGAMGSFDLAVPASH